MKEPRKIRHKFIKEYLSKKKIGRGDFLSEVEKEKFLEMLSKNDEAFVFAPKEINCVDPSIIVSMVIFTILHVHWNLKPFLVLKVFFLKLIDLLKKGSSWASSNHLLYLISINSLLCQRSLGT